MSVGNKADVSGNDLLQYWEDDPATDVILLYLESVGNPRKFSRIARRVSRRKPIVAVKSGRTSAGVRAASSHTAAMASPDIAIDALFRQAGVIRVDTLDDLFDMAIVLGSQPLPSGPGVAILGNSGGPGILATDACVAAGLEVPELGSDTQAALRALVDPNAAVTNPVDLIASATPEIYERALPIVLDDESIDAVIVICTPTFAAPPPLVAEAVTRVSSTTSKTVVASMLAWREVPPLLGGEQPGTGVPAFATPEPAARALALASSYAAWRRRPPGAVPDLDRFDVDGIRSVAGRFLAASPHGGWLTTAEVTEVLTLAGIHVVRTVEVGNAEEAARAAEDFGFPVVVKATGPNLIHKSDAGGVRLDLRSPDEVVDAYRSMASRIGEPMTGGIVQQMAASGVETIVGVIQDPLFGPLVMFGMGGVATELLGDRAFRILPLTDLDASELVRSLRSSPLLFGYRGAPAVTVTELEDQLQRVARMAGVLPELAELDINPLIVSPEGTLVVDTRMRMIPAPPEGTVA